LPGAYHTPGIRSRPAAAALASLPVVLVYIYLHKYMVGGLTAGAVKG
jgi:ABC-type maltose transport system permease subunit